MLAMNSYSRRIATNFSPSGPSNLLSRPRLPLRSYMKPKSSLNLANIEATPFCRSKRFKSRKINAYPKIDAIKKKTPDYTENAYREAVSKLKYLLAESYAPRLLTAGKLPRDRVIYRRSNPRISETPEDSDDRSISECSRAKGFSGVPFDDSNVVETEPNRRLVVTSQNSVFPPREEIHSGSELTSFIARQEEYIEQLERESRYCKEELKNLLEKIREVVAENEALHDKNKAGLLKTFLREYENCDEQKNPEKSRISEADRSTGSGKKVKVYQALEGPNIVFESRISELEAQLTQARIELKNSREDNDASSKRYSDNFGNQASPEIAAQLDEVLREKRELNVKLEEALKNLQAAKDRENEVTQKARRSTDLVQQVEFDKYQADAEIRRLNDELDRQREKLREASQDASRRVVDERHQVERRFSQQVEQLSADVALHWDTASKSRLETEKQRRELGELKRDLGQKQAMIDDLKKELQNKISNLQSDLNEAIAEKDAAEQEVASAKLSIERNERHARQEQNRWQTEINSYKQRMERADADILHCRRENLRLSEQIASLEKEINMNKLIHSPEVQTPAITPRPEGEKDLTSMIMDMETKHVATVGGLEDALSNQAKLVSRLNAECQSLTQRLEANDRTHKEEMASLQSNLEYLSTKINDTLEHKKAEKPLISDRSNAQHKDENVPERADNQGSQISAQEQVYSNEYTDNARGQYEDQIADYKSHEESVEPASGAPNEEMNSPQDYVLPDGQKYEGQEYENYPEEYGNQDYAGYEQYDPSMYQQGQGGETEQQLDTATEDVSYQQQYQEYPENYPENNQSQELPTGKQDFPESTVVETSGPKV